MLESIHLTNFQIHEKFDIQFDKYLTTVVGRSDAGKSSIIRALRWVLLNKPSGDQFIKHGEEYTAVDLVVDGQTITRCKGAGDNLYSLGKKEYRAFGSDVPTDIAKLLNVTEENIQRQMSPHFWLSDTPGQVSKELNRIVSLDAIDNALAKAAVATRKAKGDVDSTQTRLAQAKGLAEGLAWVKDMAAQLAKVEEQYNKVQQIKEKRARIACIVADAAKYQTTAQVAVGAKPALARVLSLAVEVRSTGQQAAKLRTLLENVIQAKEDAAIATDIARKATVDLNKRLGNQCPICGGTISKKMAKKPDNRLD